MLTLVAGQGEMGGGEQMLLRVGEAARSFGWTVQVLGPSWGNVGEASAVRGFNFVTCRGSDRRSYAFAAAARLARSGLGVVWANGALPTLLATATPNPIVVHLHQRPTPKQYLAISGAKARSVAVLVPSESMRRSIPGSQVLLNWTQDLPSLARLPDDDYFTVAYLGRLSVDKGVDTLACAVDAMAREDHQGRVRLLVAGDSRFVPRESALAVQSALRRCAAEVVQLGWVEPAAAFAAADVAVVPSRWPEPFGLVAAEAMALGCPLVVSDSGALPEVVGAGYPWIFEAGDANALKRVLEVVRNSEVSNTVDTMRSRWQELFSPLAGHERLASVLASVVPGVDS